MIDISNNNGSVDFARVRHSGQQRVYLKLTEGDNFFDSTHLGRRVAAHKAGMKVGEYHFARPSRNTPHEEAHWFLEHLPRLMAGKDLRPCLDLEDPKATPNLRIGNWAAAWVDEVQRHSGHVVVIYGNPSYLEACRLPKALGRHPLWLASYGRNDGREHPFQVPPPWTRVAAHQYSSQARIAGISGLADISKVFQADALDVAVSR